LMYGLSGRLNNAWGLKRRKKYIPYADSMLNSAVVTCL
jgi:hypothetical protein